MFSRITNFFGDCKTEFQKLSWPTKSQALRMTIIVFIICAIMSVFFGFIDNALSYLLNFIY